MDDNKSAYVLEMRDITKRFPGVLALDRMNLKARPGSVHVLVGENGAGKSTLMKILSGAHSIDGGEIYFKGEKLDHQDTASALNTGISMIHQELSPVLDMTIGENIFLGREPSRGTGVLSRFVDFDRMYADTQALLDRLGLKYNPRTPMRDLSIAAMQLIEITKAISRSASLVIMDEPTSAISDTEVAMLFRQIADLKAHGVAIIYITHKMDESFQIADDITVMRDGQFVAAGPASEYDEIKLISQMVGRTISNIFPKEEVPIGEEVLSVTDLTRTGVFENVSFSVRKGEILGFAGLIGAGRTEVARAIFGLDAIDGGEVRLAGEPIKPSAPSDAIGRHQARHRDGVGRPQGRRPGPLPLRRGERVARQPLEVHLRRLHQRAGGGCRRQPHDQAPADQDPQRRHDGGEPQRRQPTEDRHRQMVARGAQGPDPG